MYAETVLNRQRQSRVSQKPGPASCVINDASSRLDGIHVLCVCLCVCVCLCEVWYKSSQTHTYAEMAAAIRMIYHPHVLLLMKAWTHRHTLAHKQTHTHAHNDR